MVSNLDSQPVNQRAFLLTLTWDVTTARFTTWQDDIVVSSNTFAAEPKMEFELPKIDGGVGNEQLKITTLALVEPWLTLGNGKAHSFVAVLLQEVDPDDLATVRTIFRGQVTSVESNVNGSPGIMRATVSGLKAFADVSLGVLCGNGCAWKFGDAMCGIDTAPLKASFAITAISDSVITVPGITPLQQSRWSRGIVTYQGLNLSVRRYQGGTQLELIRVPPATWLGVTAVFTPGCVKDIAACQFWNNVARFGGFGTKMVNYDPYVQGP